MKDQQESGGQDAGFNFQVWVWELELTVFCSLVVDGGGFTACCDRQRTRPGLGFGFRGEDLVGQDCSGYK